METWGYPLDTRPFSQPGEDDQLVGLCVVIMVLILLEITKI
jgi:hypothetical protein